MANEIKLKISVEGSQKAEADFSSVGKAAEEAGRRVSAAFDSDISNSMKAQTESLKSSMASVGTDAARAADSVEKLSEKMRLMGHLGAAMTIGPAVLSSLRDLSASLTEAQITAQKLKSVLEYSVGVQNVAGELEYLRSVTRKLGIDYNSSAEAYAKFSAAVKGSGMTLEQTRTVFEGMAQASARFGLSVDETQGAFLALSQMASKGVVSAEEMRGQLSERLPGAMKIAAQAMGVTEREFGKMMETGQVMASDFLPKFGQALKDGVEAPLNSLSQEINRFNSAWDQWKQSLANSDGSGFKWLTAGINESAAAMRALGNDAGIVKRILVSIGGFEFGVLGKGKFDTAALQDRAMAQLRSVNADIEGLQSKKYLSGFEKQTLGDLQREAESLRNELIRLAEVRGKQQAALPDLAAEFKAQQGKRKQAFDAYMQDVQSEKEKQTTKENERFNALTAVVGTSGSEYEKALAAHKKKIAEINKPTGDTSKNDAAQTFEARLKEEQDYSKTAVEIIQEKVKQQVISERDGVEQILAAQNEGFAKQAQLLKNRLAKTTDNGEREKIRQQLITLGNDAAVAAEKAASGIAKIDASELQMLQAYTAKFAQDLQPVEQAWQKFWSESGKDWQKAVQNGWSGVVAQMARAWEATANGTQIKQTKDQIDAMFAQVSASVSDVENKIQASGGSWVDRLVGGEKIYELTSTALPGLMEKLNELIEKRNALQDGSSMALQLDKDIAEYKKKISTLETSTAKTWASVIQDVDRTFSQGFAQMMNNGSSGWDAWCKSLKTTFSSIVADALYQTFARPFVLNLVANVAGLTGMNGLASAASVAGGGSNSLLGMAGTANSLYSAYNGNTGIYGQLLSSYAPNSGAFSQAFTQGFSGNSAAANQMASQYNAAAGDLWLQGNDQAASIYADAAKSTEAGSNMGQYASYAAYAYALYSLAQGDYKTAGGTAGATAGAQYGSSFGPYGTVIGAVVGYLAGSALGSSLMGGGKKTEAWASGTIGQGGALDYGTSMPTGSNEDFWRNRGSSTAAYVGVQGLETPLAATIYQIAKNLGGDASGLSLALGFNTDPKGKAKDNILGGVYDTSGNAIYQHVYDADRNTFQTELAKEAGRMTLAALSAIDLRQVTNEYLDKLDIASLTQEQVTAALQTVQSFETVATSMKSLGVSSDGLTTSLVNAFGGVQGLQAALQSYYDNFTTSEEKRANTLGKVAQALNGAGAGITESQLASWSRVDFDAWVKGLDQTTEAGRAQYQAALQVSSAFASVTKSMDEVAAAARQAAAEQQGWQEKLDVLTGKTTDRQLQLSRDLASTTDETTRALIRQVYAQQDLQTAASSAAEAAAAAAKAAAAAAEAVAASISSGFTNNYRQSNDLADRQMAYLRAMETNGRAQREADLRAYYKTEKSQRETALRDAADAERERLNAAKDAAGEQVSLIKSLMSTLKSGVSDLYGEIDSIVQQRADAATAWIEQAANAATVSGYLPDAQALSDALSNARAGMKDQNYATAFDRDFAKLVLAGNLGKIESVAGRQLPIAEQALQAAQNQLKALDSTLAVNLKSLDSLDSQLDAQIAMLNTQDAALDAAQRQIDVLRGIDSGIGNLSGSIENMAQQVVAGLSISIGNLNSSLIAQVAAGRVSSTDAAQQLKSAGVAMDRVTNVGGQSVFVSSQGAIATQGANGSVSIAANNGWNGSMDDAKKIIQRQFETLPPADFYAVAKSAGISAAMIDAMYSLPAGTANDWAKQNNLPAFDQGANRIPQDMLALVHKDEAIIPAPFNPWAPGGGSSASNTARLESLVEALTAEVQRLQSIVDTGNRHAERAATVLDDASRGRLPLSTRVTA